MINVANPYFDNESAPASGAFSFMFFPFDSIKKTPNEDLCFVKSSLTFVYVKLSKTSNARPGVRTLDTLIKSQVLCQLS